MRFFRPTLARVVLFAIFLAIAILGAREADAFGSRTPASFFPAWVLWIWLMLPLAPLHGLLEGSSIAFWAVQVVYFYLLACAIVSVAGAIRFRARA